MRKSFVIFYRKMFPAVDKKWRFGYSKGGKNFQSKGREEMFSLAPCLALLDSAEEQEAFLALYHRYNRLVLHQAKKIVGKEEWAEGVMRGVFIYIAGHFEKFSSSSPWQTARLVVLCTESRACDFLRREKIEQDKGERKAEQSCFFVRDFEERLDIERAVVRQERLQRMAREIAALPEVYRVPLELKMKDYSDGEISELLGISLTALYKRLQRAYAAVRQRMEAEDDR